MGIPIIDEIITGLGILWDIVSTIFLFLWDVVSKFFSWIMFVAPTPFKIIFFVILAYFFGNLAISSTVGFTHTCDSQGRLMEASLVDAGTYRIYSTFMKQGSSDPVSNLPDNGLAALGPITSCSRKFIAPFVLESDSEKIEITDEGYEEWFYDGAFCTECPYYTVYTKYGDSYARQSGSWCRGDVYPKENVGFACGTSWWQGCMPPKSTFWEASSNNYVCDDTVSSCSNQTEFVTPGTFGSEWDDSLKKQFFKYSELQNNDGIIQLRCVDAKTLDFIEKKDSAGVYRKDAVNVLSSDHFVNALECEPNDITCSIRAIDIAGGTATKAENQKFAEYMRINGLSETTKISFKEYTLRVLFFGIDFFSMTIIAIVIFLIIFLWVVSFFK